MSGEKTLLKAILEKKTYLDYLRVAKIIHETGRLTRREGVRGRKRLHEAAIHALVQCYLSRERARVRESGPAMKTEVAPGEEKAVRRALLTSFSRFRRARFAKSPEPMPWLEVDACVLALRPTQRPKRRLYELGGWIRQGYVVPVTKPDREGQYTIASFRPDYELGLCWYQLPGDLTPEAYEEYREMWLGGEEE